ncbi:putative G-protein coupled receptor 132 [Lissotriton helveticus]
MASACNSFSSLSTDHTCPSGTNLFVCLLCCISLDRCFAVVYPIHSLAFRSQRAAGAMCFVVTLVVFAFHLGVMSTSNQHDGVSCYETYPLQSGVAKFNYFRFVAGFLLPLAVLATSYLKIFQGVRQSSSLSQEKKAKVKHLSIGVIVIFLLCFAPYHLLLLLRTAVFSSYADPDASCVFERKVNVYFSVALAMSSLNSALDPILYILVSDSVKKDLKHAFRCQANQCQSGQEPTMTSSIKSTLVGKMHSPDNIAFMME